MAIGKPGYVTEKENKTLANKVVHGTLWVAASYTFSNILYFLRSIILIRLLTPIDFGLMGIARVVITMLTIFREPGISKALVHKKNVSKTTLNTAWIMTAIRGLALFAMLYLFSPLIARFYNNEHLNLILKFIALSFLFSGLASAGVFIFIKELNFKNKVIFEQANAISTTIVSVVLAIIFKNVWALVIGYVVGTIVGFLFSYSLHPFKPSVKFDLNAAKRLFSFGKYVFVSGIVVFLFIRGPHAMVGKVLGLNWLGFYVIAFNIANIPTTSIAHIVWQISFPTYAKLQDDLPKLREGYLKITRLIVFLSAPLAGGIFMLIPEFVQIFLGVKWMPIVLPVRILCIMGFLRSIFSTVSPVFYGIGRPDLEFKFACFNLTVLAIFVYPFTVSMGIVGTSIVFSFAYTMSTFFILATIYKLIQLNVERTQFLKILFFPLAGIILMCFSIFLIKLVFSYSLIMSFTLSILIGGSFYVLALYILDKYCGYGFTETIRFAIISYKGR